MRALPAGLRVSASWWASTEASMTLYPRGGGRGGSNIDQSVLEPMTGGVGRLVFSRYCVGKVAGHPASHIPHRNPQQTPQPPLLWQTRADADAGADRQAHQGHQGHTCSEAGPRNMGGGFLEVCLRVSCGRWLVGFGVVVVLEVSVMLACPGQELH
ncbi:hypothetical protein B0T16DRAFT_34434 [Cercophora newfieldiana]|uniref:Uncharacterized protein n=1 Tax=Cercophora newfieldiana TaxID=92897 RepID=A0AA39YPJ2_9PEZI|nr:hypothetical protein B0T16DRAFT_34434 [Cercophora newfieldiana]